VNRRLILGGPGAGKTTRLLSVVDEELGIIPSYQIAFVSFTNKAVNEAADRAVKKFELERGRFPFFRTLHSMCFHQLGIRPGKVMKRSHLKEIGSLLGIEITGRTVLDDFDTSMKKGDRMLFLHDLSRATKTDPKKTWEKYGTDWDLGWYEFVKFSETLKRYKEAKGLIDFSDMLSMFVKKGLPVPIKIAIIDEAQDLTPLQWDVVDVAFRNCSRQYIAGDDDQAIYEWSGADIRRFLNLGENEREILPKSYRLPKKIFDLSKKLASKISKRYEKKWAPRSGDGSVTYVDSIADVDLTGEGSWLLLARNICHFSYLQEECRYNGIAFLTRNESSIDLDEVKMIQSYERLRKGQTVDGFEAARILEGLGIRRTVEENRAYRLSDLVSSDPGIWHDAMSGLTIGKRAYYVTILRKGYRLTDPPKIRVDTIHGVKGGEADNVVLLTDVTRGTEEGFERNPDAETRVFYVGVTRAKKNLFVVQPQTDRGFRLT